MFLFGHERAAELTVAAGGDELPTIGAMESDLANTQSGVRGSDP